MRFVRATSFALLFTLVALAPVLPIDLVPRVSADRPYSLSAVPPFTQEGNTVSLVLTVEPVGGAIGNTAYQFRFFVRDPAGKTFQSPLQNHTSPPGEQWFSIVVVYPSASFPGATSLVGQYATWVNQEAPLVMPPTVASSSFFISLTDNNGYERTETVNIRGSGYNASESVSVTIRTQTTSTLVFSQTVPATLPGIVATSWKIPRNATIDNYVLTLTGTSTAKTPPDTQTFLVTSATMSIAITSLKPTYQRTETMTFTFQPTYPDGTIASTGVALLTLAGPSGPGLTLTATYDTPSLAFRATYKTSIDNQTGTWTATIAGHAYNDADGNSGPGTTVTTTPQLTSASLSITVNANTNVAVGQEVRFNATIAYPDGTPLESGAVGAYLLYSGTPTVNETAPVIFDTGLRLWIGTYTAQPADPGGLWSLVVKASDSQAPSNIGSATRAVTLQNNTGGAASLPLYYFGIIAGLIAGLLAASFLIFKKHKVTHARLKIDLEAVKVEAGRIENQEFFKSIKDQVAKDKEG